MAGIRWQGAAALASLVMGCSLAFGQTQAPATPAAPPPAAEAPPPATAGNPNAPAAPAKKSLTITSGSTMTQWKWQELKAKWAREKGKWGNCRSQAKEQKLHGPKSWHFIADCMIKVARPQPAEADKAVH